MNVSSAIDSHVGSTNQPMFGFNSDPYNTHKCDVTKHNEFDVDNDLNFFQKFYFI